MCSILWLISSYQGEEIMLIFNCSMTFEIPISCEPFPILKYIYYLLNLHIATKGLKYIGNLNPHNQYTVLVVLISSGIVFYRFAIDHLRNRLNFDLNKNFITA